MAFVSPFTPRSRNRLRTPFRARGRAGSANPWTPAKLVPTALYDAHLGGSSTQITDGSGNELDALAFGATTAAPTYLPAPASGEEYLYFPSGSVTNAVSAPDLGDRFDITDDVDLRADVYLPALLATTGPVISRGSSYYLQIVNTGAIRFTIPTVYDSTSSSTPFSTRLGQWVQMRATRTRSSGDVSFYFRTDGLLAPDTGWTLINTQTGLSTAAMGQNSNALVVGSGINGNFTGRVRRAIVKNFAGAGTTIADFQASLCAQTGYTDSLGNVWTVGYATSGLTTAVKSTVANDAVAGVVTDGSNDVATGPAAGIPALTAADSCTLFTVTRPRATMVANMVLFSTRSGSGAGVALRMASATTVVADVSDGTSTATTPAVTITPGTRYVLGVIVDSGGTARCFANNTLGSTVARTGNTETGAALTVFANSTPGNFGKTHSRVPYAALPIVVSADNLARLVTYYGGGV